MTRYLLFPALALVCLLLNSNSYSQTAAGKLLRVGLHLPAERDELFGLDLSAKQSLKNLGRDWNLFTAVRHESDAAKVLAFAADLGRQGFDLIFTVGPRFSDIWRDLAIQYPNSSFVVLDAAAENDRSIGLVFEEHAAAFILGAGAATTAPSKRIGFLGAVDNPSIRRLLMAFRAGVALVDNRIQVEERFLSSTLIGWQDETVALATVESLLSRSIDGLFLALGPMTAVVIKHPAVDAWLAADSNRYLFLATSPDLAYVHADSAQRRVFLMKRGDKAMQYVFELFTEKSLKPGILSFGLQSGGIEIIGLEERSMPSLQGESERRLHSIRQDVIDGQIKVPDYFRIF